MSPLVSNDLIMGALILFIVVSISSNTLNYMSVQTNNDLLEQDKKSMKIIEDVLNKTQKISEHNNELLNILKDMLSRHN